MILLNSFVRFHRNTDLELYNVFLVVFESIFLLDLQNGLFPINTLEFFDHGTKLRSWKIVLMRADGPLPGFTFESHNPYKQICGRISKTSELLSVTTLSVPNRVVQISRDSSIRKHLVRQYLLRGDRGIRCPP